MALEIERKFLLKNDNWRKVVKPGISIIQGYLNSHIDRVVRVRIYGDQAYLTIKGKTTALTRSEFEYEIPKTEAIDLLKLCERPLIEKIRYTYTIDGLTWEIDEFDGENKGLIVAEIELEHESQAFQQPDWLDEEVSLDSKYFNAALISKPYTTWSI